MAFNTTPFHGKVSRIEKNDVAAGYSIGWSIDVSVDLDEVSRQGQNWKEFVAGLAGATGNMEYYFVAGNTEQKALMDNIVAAAPGTVLTDLKFLLDGSTNAFTGNIIVTGMNVSTNISGSVKGSFPFTVNGALALTDSA